MENNQLNNIKIKLRTDDLSNWVNVNPVLKYGELAIVIDSDGNENIKIGNGISAFNDLKYLNQNVLKSDLIQTKDIQAKSITQGYNNKATPTSLATGIFTEADGQFGVVHGIEAKILSSDDYAFVFNGTNLPGINERYTSHGEGTFNINPVNGLSGFYIGNDSLIDILKFLPLSGGTLSGDLNLGGKDINSARYIKSAWFQTTSNIAMSDSDAATKMDAIVVKRNDGWFYTRTKEQLRNDIGAQVAGNYLTAHQDISGKLNKTEFSTVSASFDTKEHVAQVSTDIVTQTNAVVASTVAAIPTKVSQLTNDSEYLTSHQSLDNYYTKSEVSSANQISSALSSIPKISKLSYAEYESILTSNSIADNTVYIISDDYVDAYKQQIKNLANGTDDTDAVNLKQVSSMIDSHKVQTQMIDQNDFYNKVSTDTLEEGTFYVVSGDYVNAYNKQVKYVADATNQHDAVNLGQLNDIVTSINQKFDDYSEITHTHNYTTSAQVSSIVEGYDYVNNTTLTERLKEAGGKCTFRTWAD